MHGLQKYASVWQKRFRGVYPADIKNRSKQIRFLQYRGFTQEQINIIFNDVDHA